MCNNCLLNVLLVDSMITKHSKLYVNSVHAYKLLNCCTLNFTRFDSLKLLFNFLSWFAYFLNLVKLEAVWLRKVNQDNLIFLVSLWLFMTWGKFGSYGNQGHISVSDHFDAHEALNSIYFFKLRGIKWTIIRCTFLSLDEMWIMPEFNSHSEGLCCTTGPNILRSLRPLIIPHGKQQTQPFTNVFHT